jgi:hypothetical protein
MLTHICVPKLIISEMPGFCLSKSTDKGQRGLPFIGGMRSLIGGRAGCVSRRFVDASMDSEASLFGNEGVRPGGQRLAERPNSRLQHTKFQ